MKLAQHLRNRNFEIFDDWLAPGPQTDDNWRDYERQRGHTYKEALKGHAGRHVFEFDKFHLDRCDGAVLVMPAGRSGHIELGYVIGCGKPGFILFDKEPRRFDVMYQFATEVCFSERELFKCLKTWL
jgi:nucleoside 2-deoxyribosyltransferase